MFGIFELGKTRVDKDCKISDESCFQSLFLRRHDENRIEKFFIFSCLNITQLFLKVGRRA
jgi:hypothetical protein